jgi:D-3-phosphoglycerate dehydrogenase / 2-oxoglutarate reductase
MHSSLRIVIAEKISDAAIEQLKEPNWTVLTADQLGGNLTGHLESADALIVRSAVQADAALLSHAKKMPPLARASR